MDASPTIFLSGAGGGSLDFDVFRSGDDDRARFEIIGYPDWRTYIIQGYSASRLVEDLAARIVAAVPQGPIRIVGLSLGGHLGYGVGIHLQSTGREISSLCAIDSFMFASSAPSKGWQTRAARLGFDLVSRRRGREFYEFLRSRFWRSLARLCVGRFQWLLKESWFEFLISRVSDPILETELNMRLLVSTVTPWMAAVIEKPIILKAPVKLLRTAAVAGDDIEWQRRCSNLEVFEIPGHHHNLFEPENVGSLHKVFLSATRSWRE